MYIEFDNKRIEVKDYNTRTKLLIGNFIYVPWILIDNSEDKIYYIEPEDYIDYFKNEVKRKELFYTKHKIND